MPFAIPLLKWAAAAMAGALGFAYVTRTESEPETVEERKAGRTKWIIGGLIAVVLAGLFWGRK